MSSKQAIFAVVAMLAAVPAAAMAQDQTRILPPLAGVAQIVVAEPVLSDSKIAGECGIEVPKVQEHITNYLAKEGLPVISSASGSEQMSQSDVFRVTMKPEIATLKDGVVSCVSWVGLKAESQHTLRVPPVVNRKNVTVSYWSRGGLVMTPLVDHMTGMQNAYTILLNGFVKQYRIDNPGATIPLKQDIDPLRSTD